MTIIYIKIHKKNNIVKCDILILYLYKKIFYVNKSFFYNGMVTFIIV